MSWAGVSNSFQLQGEQSWDLFTKFNLKNILKKYKNTSADLKKNKERKPQPTNQSNKKQPQNNHLFVDDTNPPKVLYFNR